MSGADAPGPGSRRPRPLRGEAARLAALRRYRAVDPTPELSFDAIVMLARDLFDVPMAAVSLVDQDKQWFKARIGLAMTEIPRPAAVCNVTITLGVGEHLAIPDLTADPRFADLPVVRGPPYLRFYAGAPILTRDHRAIGTVIVLDTVPRSDGIDARGAMWLRSLALLAREQFDLRLEARLAERATKAALAARDGQARLRAAQEAAGAIAFELKAGDRRVAGHALRALHGLPKQGPLAPADVLARIHPEDHAPLLTERDRLLRDGGAFYQEYRVLLPQGGLRWVAARGTVSHRPEWLATGVVLDISERRAAEERQVLLRREVDHRAKNALQVALAAVQLTRAPDQAGLVAAITGRVGALARSHSLLAKTGWASTDLRLLAAGELAAFGPRVSLVGAPVALAAHAVQPLGMLIHELGTNALKHGALSHPDGGVTLSWQADAADLVVVWEEWGGPPIDGPPSNAGFGARLLRMTVAGQLGGRIAQMWRTDGLRVEMRLPTRRLLEAPEPG